MSPLLLSKNWNCMLVWLCCMQFVAVANCRLSALWKWSVATFWDRVACRGEYGRGQAKVHASILFPPQTLSVCGTQPVWPKTVPMLSSDSRTDQCVSLRLGAGDANDLLVTQYWRGRSTFFQFLITSKILKGGGVYISLEWCVCWGSGWWWGEASQLLPLKVPTWWQNNSDGQRSKSLSAEHKLIDHTFYCAISSVISVFCTCTRRQSQNKWFAQLT